jgi:hypothetical protein
MSDNVIEFHAVEKDWIPAPFLASRALPQWFRDQPGDVELPEAAGTMHTVKQCPPFLDAMTTGYIIPLAGDVNFTRDQSGALAFDCPDGDTTIELHHPAQLAGSPWADSPVIKFINPWIIVTPPGYSTLYLPPLNHEPNGFQILAGVVDTDTFYAHVNFPAVCLLPRGSNLTLKRGTPLVQVIPFKRETWRHETGHADARRLVDFTRQISHNHHVYREEYQQRKTFG